MEIVMPNRRNPSKPAHVALLIRITEDDKAWIERVAAENNLSRDSLMRLIFSSARATWDSYEAEAKQSLFSEMKNVLVEAAQEVIRDAVERSPRVKVEKALRTPPRPRR
jgi:hypothetical protein